jgi:hypothetical protein
LNILYYYIFINRLLLIKYPRLCLIVWYVSILILRNHLFHQLLLCLSMLKLKLNNR